MSWQVINWSIFKFHSYGDGIVAAKEHSDMAEEKSPSLSRNF
jgi:hypothetical protein